MAASSFTGKVVAGTSMSLDGFINDRNGNIGPLYRDFEAYQASELLQRSIRTTGAVVMGRGTYDLGLGDLNDYEYQVPIFVLTHHPPATPPAGQNDKLTLTFVTGGIASALEQAKAAAGDQDVTVVGGANTAQQLLQAGLVDELHVDIVPLLLGQGLRFFKRMEALEIELALIEVVSSPARTSLLYRVVK
jgi:dihydrofolate reductase